MDKRTQVHMLPTNGKDIAMLSKRVKDGMLQSANGTEGVANCNTMWQPQHLYFTIDEEPKEGDWMYNTQTKEVFQLPNPVREGFIARKIIATTDPKLKIKNYLTGVEGRYFDMKHLPQPSQAFIEKFCKVGGIDEVDVEYEEEGRFAYTGDTRYIPKVDTVHNTITTHRIVEKMYSIDDIEAYCDKYPNDTELGREIRKLIAYVDYADVVKEINN